MNEFYLLPPWPGLDLFFSIDGKVNIIIDFIIDSLIKILFLGKPIHNLVFMFPYFLIRSLVIPTDKILFQWLLRV